MTKRVTIIIDPDNLENLFSKQSKGIKELSKPYSFSRAVNDVLRAGFRNESAYIDNEEEEENQ